MEKKNVTRTNTCWFLLISSYLILALAQVSQPVVFTLKKGGNMEECLITQLIIHTGSTWEKCVAYAAHEPNNSIRL